MARIVEFLTLLEDEVEHLNSLSDDLGTLLVSKVASDVTLMIESKKFYCHKVILASRSEYFRALLFNNMKESAQSEVELIGISSEAFEFVLKYIYTGKIDLTYLMIERILDILQIAHQYQFKCLEKSVINYLKKNISISNVFIVFEKALLLNLSLLECACSLFVERHANKFISHNSLMSSSSTALLKKLFIRNSFCVEEIEVFRAIYRWIKHNRSKKTEKQDVLDLVRLPLINARDMINEVWPSNLFPDETILQAMNIRFNSQGNLNYRGCTDPGGNKVTSINKFRKAKFVTPNDSDIYYRMEIEVVLEKPFITNYIEICRNGSDDNNELFYDFEKTTDGKKWFSMVNYVKHLNESGSIIIQYPATVAERFRFHVDLKQLQYDSRLDVECMFVKYQPVI